MKLLQEEAGELIRRRKSAEKIKKEIVEKPEKKKREGGEAW